MFNQKGSAAVMAVGIMVILSLFAVAVLPMVTNEIKLSKINSDAIEAQFAAEAGAKRAINAFYQHATDWSWLSSEQQLIKNVTNKTYSVAINKLSSDTYEVTSTGTVNGVSRKVAVIVKVSSGSNIIFDYLKEIQGPNQNIFTKTIFAGGALSLDHHANITGSIAANGAISVNPHSNISGDNTQYANIQPNPDFYHEFAPSKYLDGAKFPTASGGKYTLSQQKYYVNGSLTINKNTLLDVTTENGMTIIYVNGSVFIDQNVDIASGDNILLIVNGSITISQNLNKNYPSFGNLVVIAAGAMSVSQNANINGGLYANGSISIAQNANIAYPQSGPGGVSVTWR